MIRKDISLSTLNSFRSNTMIELLGIEVTEIGSNYLVGTMPVDKRTHQPAGLLHGGASAAMIESLGSLGSSLIVDQENYGIVGIEINANHIRGVAQGVVTAKVEIVHCGKSTHIWKGDIVDDQNRLVCTGRLTILVVDKRLKKS